MKQTAPRSTELPPAETMLKQHAAKKLKLSRADRQASLAARMAASLAAKASLQAPLEASPAPPVPELGQAPPSTVPVIAPDRPKPASGQVWSAVSPTNGRLYVRIVAVRQPATDAPYVTAVRIAPDGTRLLDTILKREYQRTSLDPATRAMDTAYVFEPTITAETETLDLSTSSAASGAEETPMSTNHAETVPTATTAPPMKKAALTAMVKAKAAAPKPVKVATPKATKPVKVAAPKTEKKAARSYTVPAAGTVIHKTYKGKELEPIKALAEGRFSYKGKVYETIHELGTFIRGGKPTWAYEFFGLTKKDN